MSADLVSNLLEKLKAKTGREWSFADLMRLAQKLPELNSGNIDTLFDELNDLGLELPDETRQKVIKKLEEKPNMSLDDIQDSQDVQVVKRKLKDTDKKKESAGIKPTAKSKKQTSLKQTSLKQTSLKQTSPSSKKSLWEQVRELQNKTKKRRKR